MRPTLFAALCLTLLSACSSDEHQASVPKEQARAPTVIDPQLKALEDAKQVQAIHDEAERKRREALEDAGG